MIVMIMEKAVQKFKPSDPNLPLYHNMLSELHNEDAKTLMALELKS